MYAADLPHPDPDASRLVEEYLELAEQILREVFGYADTGRDLLWDLAELEDRYHAISETLRRHGELVGHFEFVLSVTLGGAA